MTDTPIEDIPVVILCGGKGTRIREASEAMPKPMIDIGGKPVVWHIMKMYEHHGFRRFVLLLGYKAWTIKEYFIRYREQVSDFTLQLGSDAPLEFHGDYGHEDWTITLAYTGLETLTSARIDTARDYLGDGEFMVTYGDGVADLDLGGLVQRHRDTGGIGTVTAVHPTSRYGELGTGDDGRVSSFAEKPDLSQGLINGGFFMFSHEFFDYVKGETGMLETGPLQALTRDGELGYFIHEGFWRGMDTYREYVELNRLWDADEAPWRVWD